LVKNTDKMNCVTKYILLLVLTFSVLMACSPKTETGAEVTPQVAVPKKYGIVEGNFIIEKGVIKNGDFFGQLMEGAGVSNSTVQRVVKAGEGVFDIRKLKLGNEYEFFYEKDSLSGKGEAAYFVYERDALSHVVFALKDTISVSVFKKEVVAQKKYVEVSVSGALWNDVINAGASPVLALRLSDIYAWTIDFFGLQRGDSFRVVYDELSHNGEFIDINEVYYCEFTHGGKTYTSVMFQDGEKGHVYWNENGESLRKAFLKAPLQFKRISSKFTYRRLHPVHKVHRAHTGVDYAAPSGTPVMSIGDGVVISKGWGGGGGNTVKIRHNSVYTSAYLHLSRYAKGLKKGDRVKQGQVIGYVGSTGTSTGPHLDFRVWKNGTPIDPLKMESPSVEPVSSENMEAFKARCASAKAELDSLAALKYVEAVMAIL
jgi:murein DD-endopeptidase MepM/ murein hydrolase activator NlpD